MYDQDETVWMFMRQIGKLAVVTAILIVLAWIEECRQRRKK